MSSNAARDVGWDTWSSGGNGAGFLRWAEHAVIWRWFSLLARDCYQAVGFGGALVVAVVVVGGHFLWRFRRRVSAYLRRNGVLR